jgi:Holliday junction resolvasome RuvABC endonuclease subunit
MDKILSLDASTTSTGWAVFEENKLIDYGKICPSQSLDWRERISLISKELTNIIEKYKPNKIAIEDVPLKKGGMKILVQLGACQGIVIALAEIYNINVTYITVGSWRKYVGLFNGTVEGKTRDELKKHSVEKANKLYDLDLVWKSPKSKFNDDDISDAILIGRSIIKN